MSARLELYAVTDGDTVYGYDPALDTSTGDAAPRLVGFVSANDDDEQSLFELLTGLAARTPLDAQGHGTGRIAIAALPAVLDELHELVDEHAHESDELVQQWAREVLGSAASIQACGAALAWRMRYDRGGSVDDGADEFPTAWSGRGG